MTRRIATTVFVLGLLLSAEAVYAAWSGPPSGTPPACPSGQPGCDAPLNISNSAQQKLGDLTLFNLYVGNRVGIGTVNPAGKLDVNGTLCISGSCISSWTAAGGGQWTTSGNNIYNANSGNVGIGSAVPVYKLDIVGSAWNNIQRIYSTGGSGAIDFWDTNGTRRGVIYSDSSGFGLLNNGTGWALQIPYGTSNVKITGTAYANGQPLCQADGTNCPAAGGSPTFTDVYTNGWFRNNSSLTGLYNQANGNHLYSEAPNYWTMTSAGSTAGGLIFRDQHQSTLRGYVYHDTSGFGLLHSSGGWAVRTNPGSTELMGTVYANGGTICASNNNCGYLTSGSLSNYRQFNTWQNSHYSGTDGAEYATIFYDTNNSGYYVDPNSNSRMANIQTDTTLLSWPGYNGISQSAGNYLWPGSYDRAWQQSWYLRSGPDWGLYTNTSFNIQGVYDQGNRVYSAVNPPPATNTSGLVPKDAWWGSTYYGSNGDIYLGYWGIWLSTELSNLTNGYANSAGSANSANSATYATYINTDAYNMKMHWSGQGGQPTWLWGSNDGANSYVWNPSNFSVNYANSAGSASSLNGYNQTSFLQFNTWQGSNYYGTNGDMYMPWAGNWLSTVLNSKQAAGNYIPGDTWWGSTYHASNGNIYLGYLGTWLSTKLDDLTNGYASSAGYANSAGSASSLNGYNQNSFLQFNTWQGSNYYGTNGDMYMSWAGNWLSTILSQKATGSGISVTLDAYGTPCDVYGPQAANVVNGVVTSVIYETSYCSQPIPETPYLFVWDGHGYKIASDFLFGFPKTNFASYAEGIAEYNAGKVGSDLFVLGVKPVAENGVYKIKIGELEFEESFIDSFSLHKVSHPEGTALVTDNLLKEVYALNESALSNLIRPTNTDVAGEGLEAVAYVTFPSVGAHKLVFESLLRDESAVGPIAVSYKDASGEWQEFTSIQSRRPNNTVYVVDIPAEVRGKFTLKFDKWNQVKVKNIGILKTFVPQKYTEEVLPMESATDNSSGDSVASKLSAKDGAFVQVKTGDYVFANFKDTGANAGKTSFFIRANGFYVPHKDSDKRIADLIGRIGYLEDVLSKASNVVVETLTVRVNEILTSIGEIKDKLLMHNTQIQYLQSKVDAQQKTIDELQKGVRELQGR
ncbi:MAG: hypothetical protein Q8P17_01790 [bacterium]|nr:hypothetical protein [bacterium]